MKSNNIKYVFMANSLTLKEIGEYPSTISSEIADQTRQIFTKYCNAPGNKYDHRNKIDEKKYGGVFHFKISPTNIFYLVLTDPKYGDRYVYELIDEIQKENIPLLTDEKGELNKLGRKSLAELIDAFQEPSGNNICLLRNDLDDVKVEMKKNINRVLSNVEDAQALDEKAIKIRDGAEVFKKDANTLRKITWWRNCKWTIILVVLIVGILLVIILPLTVRGN